MPDHDRTESPQDTAAYLPRCAGDHDFDPTGVCLACQVGVYEEYDRLRTENAGLREAGGALDEWLRREYRGHVGPPPAAVVALANWAALTAPSEVTP
jgi:hypothetical protein